MAIYEELLQILKKTESARHLPNNICQLLELEILMLVTKDKRTRRNLEAFFYCSSKTIIE